MKICVGVNHAAPFHVGGSEKVVQQITESMVNDFGHECHVLTRFCADSIGHNGVHVHKVSNTFSGFADQVNKLDPDYMFIYSDCFCHWKPMVMNPGAIKARKGVALVGMNSMHADHTIRDLFVKRKKHFDAVVHSPSYEDFSFCSANGIDVNVIPNAISFDEMKDQSFSFREKYGIETEHIVLCVSNFFPGKGQEYLYHILEQLAKKRSDFTAIFMAQRVSFNVANNIMTRFQRQLKRASFKNQLIMNAPREDVVQAFQEASVFAFPSQQEVSPIVALESMASSCPWVALPVGNMPLLKGGIIVPAGSKQHGMYKYTSKMHIRFMDALDSILSDADMRNSLGQEGQEYIRANHDWNKVKIMYKDLFEAHAND